jgi:DNA-binding transcriptional ArsR family regulator
MEAPARTLVTDHRALRAALTPLRRDLLERLRVPASAAQLADAMGLPRQKLGYHLRALEAAGLIRLAEERRRRGFTERLLVAADYLIDPDLLAAPVRAAAQDSPDLHAADHLINAASAMVRDVARMRQQAEAAGARLLTITMQAELGFSTPAEFEQFAREAAEAITVLAHRYSAPDGHRYKLVTGIHPVAAISVTS